MQKRRILQRKRLSSLLKKLKIQLICTLIIKNSLNLVSPGNSKCISSISGTSGTFNLNNVSIEKISPFINIVQFSKIHKMLEVLKALKCI